MKTVRFATVVSHAGKPEHHLTWNAPGRDPPLQRAAKEYRLMTIHQHARGNKKDFGAVALESGRDAQYWIFPRSLRPYLGMRVVAIDYELVAEKLSLAVPARRKESKTSAARENVISFPGSERNASRLTAEIRMPKPPVPALPAPTLPEIKKIILVAVREIRARKTVSAVERLSRLATELRV